MTPLQQKRHRELEASLVRAHEQRDIAIARLVRTEGRLKDLLKTKARLEKAMARFVSPVPDLASQLEVPTFLQRSKVADQKDAEAVAQIKADQAERKKLKATAQAEARKAKASGETKRMPLTGRAALQYLRTGSRA